MTPIAHHTNNTNFGDPEGMEDNVQVLPVTMATMDGAGTVLMSMWEPTREERAAIACGANVVLSVMGGVMPPVLIFAATPAQLTASLRPADLAKLN